MKWEFFVILSAFFVAGCIISHPKYPKTWPVLQVNINEKSFAGVYACEGVVEPPIDNFPDYHPNLAYILFEPKQTTEKCDSLQVINTSPGMITVNALIKGKIAEARSFKAGQDYSFEKEGLKGKTEVGNAGDIFIAVKIRQTRVYLDTTGDAVIKSSDGGAGLALVIPFVASEHNWFKFKRLSPP